MKDLTLDQQKEIYKSLFETQNGKFVLNDLKSVFCVNSDLLSNSGNLELDNHHREGMRLAFRYIESLLTTTKSND